MKRKIGEFIKEYSVRNSTDEDIPVYSVTNENGFCTGYFSKDVSSKDRTTYKIVPKGCFAYNPSRINVGSIDWQNCEDRVIVSPLYVVFEVSDELDRQYLLHYLKSNVANAFIRANGAGSVRDNLRFKDLSDIPIQMVPVEEQREIVKKIDSVSDLIHKGEAIIKELDQLVKSRFVEMFGDERNSKCYPVIKVKDVADVQVGVVIKPSQYYTDSEHGVKAFRSLNIGEMHIKDDDWVYFSEEGQKKNAKSVLHKNDLVIVRSGAPGTACVITDAFDGSNAVDVIIAHPDMEKVNPYYLCAYTNYPHGKHQIEEGTGGAAQQHFNVGKYKEMDLIYPPKAEQDAFVAFVAQTDKSKHFADLEVVA